MFGKSRLKKFAEKSGGFESMVSELIEELKNMDFFVADIKSTKILLKQKTYDGFNVIVLILKSETEIKSEAVKRANLGVDKNIFSLVKVSQKNIASAIINGM